MQPFLGHRGGDYLYYDKLKELERAFPLTIQRYEALLPVALGNVFYAADAVWRRLEHRFRWRMPGWWSTLRRLSFVPQAEIDGGRADVLYTNFFIPINHIAIPTILESDFNLYGTPDEHGLVKRWLHVPEWFIRRVTVIAVRHEPSRAAFVAAHPGEAHKVVVVPFYLPWVEPVSGEQVIRKFERFGDGEMRILFVGNDARRKGLPSLLKAYRSLRRAGRDVNLTVVSDFRDGAIELTPDITFYSGLTVHEVQVLMAEAHIFAMPSRQEAEGLVFFEAMANGCALLIPRTSPQQDLFGEYGLGVPPDDVEAITEAVERFLDDGEFTRVCALRARQRFVERFHHTVVGKQYWDLFRRAVMANKPRIDRPRL